MIKKTIIFLFLLGFSIFLNNPTNTTKIYLIWWLDHPYDYSEPMNMAGGELKPNESYAIKNNYPPGKWFFQWSGINSQDNYYWEKYLEIKEENTGVITEPGKVRVE